MTEPVGVTVILNGKQKLKSEECTNEIKVSMNCRRTGGEKRADRDC